MIFYKSGQSVTFLNLSTQQRNPKPNSHFNAMMGLPVYDLITDLKHPQNVHFAHLRCYEQSSSVFNTISDYYIYFNSYTGINEQLKEKSVNLPRWLVRAS